jgi:DUF1680 family protein
MVALVALLTARGAAAQRPSLQPVPCSAVKITSEFWSSRQRVNRQETIPHLIEMCQREGRVRNMLRAAGRLDGDFEGTRRHDADLFKVIEAASYSLMLDPDPQLNHKLDELVAAVSAAQRDDGYLHTYAQVRFGHERRPTKIHLFAAGHLIHAGVTHHEATRNGSLLDAAVRMADLTCSQYGPGRQIDVPSHPVVETALVRLAEATGRRRYEELAAFFINQRGEADRSGRQSYGVHGTDAVPLRRLQVAQGHAIAGLFLFSGMVDVGVRTGDEDLLTASRRMFDDAVSRRMYVTGAMGRQSDERFTEPFALDNRTSIGEGCQSAALMQLAQRLLLVDADARYADVIERVMVNNLAANVGLDGRTFYYHNRLSARPEDAGGRPYAGIVTETDKTLMPRNCLDRQPWFKVPCCPPNVAMAIATIGQYVYATGKDALYVSQYLGSKAAVLLDGTQLRITQKTRYPWDGRIAVTIDPAQSPWTGAVCLRIPDWCRDFDSTGGLYVPRRRANKPSWSARINGRPVDSAVLRSGYLKITRNWRRGDVVELDLPMPVLRVDSHPNVGGNRGRIAIQRGPVVYCVEGVDHGGRVRDLYLPAEAELRAEHRPRLLGGVTVVEGTARRQRESVGDDKAVGLLAVPYAVWANREVGEMDVWLPKSPRDLMPSP